jgi:hypothetical protein
LGKWEAISGPGEATGSFSFALQLQSQVMIRTNYAEYPATSERPADRHDDLMLIYWEEALGLRADYYDSEGHVIRYAGQVVGLHEVVFTSEPTDSGPGFRLSYQLQNDGTLHGAFEIAARNQPGVFAPYLSWSARREERRDKASSIKLI